MAVAAGSVAWTGRLAGREWLRARRGAVWAAHRLEVDEVLLTRRGAVPKTSSGKVRRRACRDLYLAGALPSATAGKAGVSTA